MLIITGCRECPIFYLVNPKIDSSEHFMYNLTGLVLHFLRDNCKFKYNQLLHVKIKRTYEFGDYNDFYIITFITVMFL